MDNPFLYMSDWVGNGSILLLLLQVIVHLFFASGVARDLHVLQAKSLEPCLVPGFIWVLATLLGGVYIAAVYWLIHHSHFFKL